LLKVKLSGDPCFGLVETEADLRSLEEGFWKVADLTGQDLVIAQQTTGEPRPVSLAFVRLVPLTEDEVRFHRGRSGSRRLIALNDGWSFYFNKGACSARDIQEEIEPYRDTDFGKLFWETWFGDTSNYPAKVGVRYGEGAEDFARPGDFRLAECMQEMRNRGLDSLQVVLEHAHGMGLELYAGMRMGAFGFCPPLEGWEGVFFREHPEFRCRDYDGTEVSHLSYAFPEVRQYVLSLLEDVTRRYDVDGVNLIFRRGQPFLLYEEPLVEGFRRETGIDATGLGQKDTLWQWYEKEFIPAAFWCVITELFPPPEELVKQRVIRLSELSSPVQDWLRFRAEAVTEFMRMIRGLLMRVGKGQKISAVVFGNEADNLYYGLDVETWVKEGLVDIIIPYTSPDWLWPRYSKNDMEFFKRITKDSACGLYPNVMPRRMEIKEYVKKAYDYYQQGADGLAFWDTNARHSLLNQWQVVRNLGHKEELGKWLETGRFSRRFLQLRRLGNYSVDRYHPFSGG
jgi:hypothetical protein